MGTGSSTEETTEEEDATEITNESGGFHLIELHLPTAGGILAVAVAVACGLLGLRWYIKNRRKKSVHRASKRKHLEELELGAIHRAPEPVPAPAPPPPPPPPAPPLAQFAPPVFPPYQMPRIGLDWGGGGAYGHLGRGPPPQRFDQDRFEPVHGGNDQQHGAAQDDVGLPAGRARGQFRRAREDQAEQ